MLHCGRSMVTEHMHRHEWKDRRVDRCHTCACLTPGRLAMFRDFRRSYVSLSTCSTSTGHSHHHASLVDMTFTVISRGDSIF